MKLAAYAAHTRHIPVVLDPVGAGATTYRNEVIHELLLHGQNRISSAETPRKS